MPAKLSALAPQREAPFRHLYPTTEVARILGVTAARVRTLARTGVRPPQRAGRRLLFSFQDLVLLRTAHGLRAAKVPASRIGRVLSQLARQLPAGRPISGVRIYADGRRVVVRHGRTAWQPEDGQVVFSFAVNELAKTARIGTVAPPRAAPQPGPANRQRDASRCYDRALVLEQAGQLRAAREAYRRTFELDPTFADAYINLGRLVHEGGDAGGAAQLYEQAIQHARDDQVAHYNLAVALEDLDRPEAALVHYQRALTIDPEFADAHFNLGRLLEKLNRPTDALRHLRIYRRLTEDEG